MTNGYIIFGTALEEFTPLGLHTMIVQMGIWPTSYGKLYNLT